MREHEGTHAQHTPRAHICTLHTHILYTDGHVYIVLLRMVHLLSFTCASLPYRMWPVCSLGSLIFPLSPPPPCSPQNVQQWLTTGTTACNGRGACDTSTANSVKVDACTCYSGFSGGDCAQIDCPKGNAWWDEPSATNTAHAMAECSNMGICDRGLGGWLRREDVHASKR